MTRGAESRSSSNFMQRVAYNAQTMAPRLVLSGLALAGTGMALTAAACDTNGSGKQYSNPADDPTKYHDWKCNAAGFACDSPSYDKAHPTPTPNPNQKDCGWIGICVSGGPSNNPTPQPPDNNNKCIIWCNDLIPPGGLFQQIQQRGRVESGFKAAQVAIRR